MTDLALNHQTPNRDAFRLLLVVQVLIILVTLVSSLYHSKFGYPALKPIDHMPPPEVNPEPPLQPGTLFVAPKQTQALATGWQLPQQAAFEQQFNQAVLELTNKERTSRGLQALQPEPGLAKAAAYHSADMARRDFFDHINPEDIGPAFRVGKIHRRYIGTVGENIAWFEQPQPEPRALAQSMVTSWMNSTPHRKNILNPDFSHLGMGSMRHTRPNGAIRVYGTQVFGGLAAYLAQPLPAQLPQGGNLQPNAQGPLGTASSAHLIDLATNQTLANQSLNLSFPGQPGVYQLVFHFPKPQQQNMFTSIRGPIVKVP